jgi:phosphoserine phosphatase
VAGGRLTGRFLTKNCYGQEKVRRVTQVLPKRDNYILVAYGDSRGDKELLDYADVRHYKPFREGK